MFALGILGGIFEGGEKETEVKDLQGANRKWKRLEEDLERQNSFENCERSKRKAEG